MQLNLIVKWGLRLKKSRISSFKPLICVNGHIWEKLLLITLISNRKTTTWMCQETWITVSGLLNCILRFINFFPLQFWILRVGGGGRTVRGKYKREGHYVAWLSPPENKQSVLQRFQEWSAVPTVPNANVMTFWHHIHWALSPSSEDGWHPSGHSSPRSSTNHVS